jgi:hypothetical protein
LRWAPVSQVGGLPFVESLACVMLRKPAWQTGRGLLYIYKRDHFVEYDEQQWFDGPVGAAPTLERFGVLEPEWVEEPGEEEEAKPRVARRRRGRRRCCSL